MTEGLVSRRNLFAVVSLFAAVMFLCLGVGHARAESKPFHIDFDQSNIQLGTVGDLPLDSLATGATIDGTIDNGVVTIPADGFKFPSLGITDPVAVSGAMALDGPATGTFDEKTGELNLDAKAGIYVSVDVKGLVDTLQASGLDLGTLLGGNAGDIGGFSITSIIGLIPTLTCGFTNMDAHFTTGTTAPTSLATGAPFTKGTDGPGALATEWGQLGVFGGKTRILGLIDACSFLKSALPGLLGTLTSGTGSTLPIDLGSLDIASLLDNLDAVNLGPSALTLTRTLDTSVPVDPPPPPDETTNDPANLKLTASPKLRTVKRGKAVNYKVKVSNTGDLSAGSVKVCVKVPKKALATKPCKTLGGVAGGKSKQGTFKVKVKPTAGKGVYKVKFTAAAKSVDSARTSVRILAR